MGKKAGKRAKSRRLGGMVAVAATAAMAAGTLAPVAPAQAAVTGPFSGFDLVCLMDGSSKGTETATRTVNCDNASRSLIAIVGDGILGVIPFLDLGFKLSEINGAGVAMSPGGAEINGSGLNVAVAAIGGTAGATSQTPLSGAISLAVGTGGKTDVVANPLGIGIGSVINHGQGVPAASSSVHALPLSIVGTSIFNSLTSGPAADNYFATSAAAMGLGGFAAATFDDLSGSRAVCTALVATASVTTNRGTTDCTGFLYLFEIRRDEAGNTDYAIKNPLALWLTPVLATFGPVLPILPGVGDLLPVLSLPLIPELRSDLIRISTGPGRGPTIESDILSWVLDLPAQGQNYIDAVRHLGGVVGIGRETVAAPAGLDGLKQAVPQAAASDVTTLDALNDLDNSEAPAPVPAGAPAISAGAPPSVDLGSGLGVSSGADLSTGVDTPSGSELGSNAGASGADLEAGVPSGTDLGSGFSAPASTGTSSGDSQVVPESDLEIGVGS